MSVFLGLFFAARAALCGSVQVVVIGAPSDGSIVGKGTPKALNRTFHRPPLSALQRSKIPITEKVTMGTMYGPVDSVADEIRYNECLDYPEKVSLPDQKVTVCGTGTRVLIFLRGRCEEYSYYLDEVGHCGATTEAAAESCMTTSEETNHWLAHAQSYYIEQCGAVAGEAREITGPSCKNMDDCIAQETANAKANGEAAKEAAELKALGIEVDEHGVPMMGGKKKRLKGKFTGRARASAGRKSRKAAKMEATKHSRAAKASIDAAFAKKR